ncbi:hypothetical protein GCM10010307_07390 [Streptomyces vastus]|uniref:CoA carboxyltransferase N-terminal domain-containing protein n=1 Tax=Streptomyces vastus TaxID=285451 RepID=A0ABN3QCA7_9ACTN
MTARQRVEQLLDEDSFVELNEFLGWNAVSPADTGDGAVCGHGTVDGRPVAVFAFGFPGVGSALSEAHAQRACTAIDFALKTGCPVITIHDTGSTRSQDSTGSLGAYGRVLRRHARASGVVPQISLITGSCTGTGVHSIALTDFTVMVDRASHLLTTAPDIVTTITGEGFDVEELGGARTHNTVSGSAHHLADSDEDAVEYVKDLLSYLPSNNLEDPPADPDEDVDLETHAEDGDLDTIVPETSHRPYDMRQLVDVRPAPEHLVPRRPRLRHRGLRGPADPPVQPVVEGVHHPGSGVEHVRGPRHGRTAGGALPAVSGDPGALLTDADFAVFPLRNPGLVSVPVGFLLGWLGSLSDRHEPGGADYRETEIRVLTGASAGT